MKSTKFKMDCLKFFFIIFLFFIDSFLFASQKEVFDSLNFRNGGFPGKNLITRMAPPQRKNQGEPSVSPGKDFKEWIRKLERDQEAINSDNFSSVLENNVCPEVEELGKKGDFFTIDEQRMILAELVKVYGKVLNYTGDHNYFYCIYHYSGFPKNKDIINVAREVLTKPYYEIFSEALRTCDREEREGNGDAYLDIESYGSSSSLNDLLAPLILQNFYGYQNTMFPEPVKVISPKRKYGFLYANLLSQGAEDLPGLVEYFSNIAFENSTCRCPGNNRCTRGCVKGGVLPQVQCWGKRTRRGRCMRYVNAAIMSTVYSFFDRYCPNRPFDYLSCLDSQAEQGTLCDQGFIFPSALCGLSLDGEDRYDLIESRGVRRRCRNWFKHNKRLFFVNSLGRGERESLEIPLFQRIEIPEDPEDLPEGAIIVSKSHSIHGHTEIKTNRRECGKGKKDFCFCSDFCDSRKGGYKWPLKPQVVFQWHPEFIRYFENNEQFNFETL